MKPTLHVYPIQSGHDDTKMVRIVTTVGDSSSSSAVIARDDLFTALYAGDTRCVYDDIVIHSRPLR